MSSRTPMLCSPLKQTVEVDWIQPLKDYIQNSYGADPNTYSEECARLNQLRQDMRGAGKDSATGRDLLYRYYGQLELLELRFPIDEHHIKVSFTWYDAFTQKATSQYSLAFEKASVIFNIAAVISCHAAHQNRDEADGLKAAFHSFQAAAGMFTYINENFLHAPSTDLSRETVKTLTMIMLGQAQEVFLEKQIEGSKSPALLAKLANQASYRFVQALEGTQEGVDKAVFARSWLTIVQSKIAYLGGLANHFQAIADEEAGHHGAAIARWQAALDQIQQALSSARSLPVTFSTAANLGSETAAALTSVLTQYHDNIREKLAQANKDNDYLYHDIIPSEASLPKIAKLSAVKAIPISELYPNQDMSRIIGPDIFSRIVPMPVTEASSVYEEEKAQLLRAEAEKVETANSEMLAALDYLKIPDIIPVFKGQAQEDVGTSPEVERCCQAVAAGGLLRDQLDGLPGRRNKLSVTLDQLSTDLDREESTCEKMRIKFGAEWTQQPSSRFSATLRSEMKRYRGTINDAGSSDHALSASYDTYEQAIKEMFTAGRNDEVDVMFQTAMIRAAERTSRRSPTSTPSASAAVGSLLDDVDDSNPVTEQVTRIEELYKKLLLVKKDRTQVLKDLKEKIHADDISQVLLLNKKSLSGQENQIFQAELEKFRPHQTRLMQSTHKQVSLLKEITEVYEKLLQNSSIRAEQAKHEAIAKQRNLVISTYETAFKAYKDISAGLKQAIQFYADMGEQVDSLRKNIEEFLSNRKAEGSRLIQHLDGARQLQSAVQGGMEREKLTHLMTRLSVSSAATPQQPAAPRPEHFTPPPMLPPKAGPTTYTTTPNATTLGSHFSMPAAVPPPPPHPAPSFTSYPPPPSAQYSSAYNPSLNSPYDQHNGTGSSSYNYSTYAAPNHPPPQTTRPPYPPPSSAPYQLQYTTAPNQPSAHPTAPQSLPYTAAHMHSPPPAEPGMPPYPGQPALSQQPTQQQPQQYPGPQGQYQPQQTPQPPPSNDPWAGLNSWR